MNRDEALFLKSVDEDRNKVSYVRIAILDQYEKPIKSIEGRVQEGSSISISGSSSMRRTCTLNFIAEQDINDLTEIDNLLSINKKIKLESGIRYNINFAKDLIYYSSIVDFPETGEIGKIYVDQGLLKYYFWNQSNYVEINDVFKYPNPILWFPQGVYVITQPNLSHNPNGTLISLNLKDKMCLLNGEMAGGLPTSITFHEYDQMIGEVVCSSDPRTDATIEKNEYSIYSYTHDDKTDYYSWTKKYGWEESSSKEIGEIVHIPQLFYDIIETVVIRFGNESPSKVIINDVPKEIKQLVRWTSSKPLYHNTANGIYTTDELMLTNEGTWRTFLFNDDIGYVYTDFTYPGELITNIGDTVCGVLDKVIACLGNYEYFYDIDGNFVFQEKRNYLNTSYLPLEIANDTQRFYLENNWVKEGTDAPITLDNNSLCVLGRENFKADYYGDQKSVYNFEEGSSLISSYNNTPSYTSIKNDYHIWGKNTDGYAIHYHLVIKDKPKKQVIWNNGVASLHYPARKIVFLTKNGDDSQYNGMIKLAGATEEGVDYEPDDWRAELYLQGLEIQAAGGRPDIYQQELLDLFDAIYEWGYYDSTQQWIPHGRFKADITTRPNSLQYFIDYLEPTDNLYSVAVEEVGTKMFSYQQDKVIRIYDNEVPDYILIDLSMSSDYKNMVMEECGTEGQKFSLIDADLYANIAIGTKGYSAQETVRDYLYQYTNYNEVINLQSIPIYYLDVNRRITVKDKLIGINGDYIINTITLPLVPNSAMTINAVRALNRLPMNYGEASEGYDNIGINDGKLYIDSSYQDIIIDEPDIKDTTGRSSIIADDTSDNKLITWISGGA